MITGRDPINRVLNRLNESVDMKSAGFESDPIIGLDKKRDVRQCPTCKGFFIVNDDVKTCPVCGVEAPVLESVEDEDEEKMVIKEEKDEVPVEVETEVEEAMDMLSNGEAKKFNEAYGRTSKLMKSGKLNIIVESKSGRMHSVVKRLNSVQKATYKLSESFKKKAVVSRRSADSKVFEAVHSARVGHVVLTEMSAVKVSALKVCERLGMTKNQIRKLKEAMEATIDDRKEDIDDKITEIVSDKETGETKYDDAAPEDVVEDVNKVIEDTGLEIIDHSYDVDDTTNTTEVQVKVQDDPDVEVNLQDVADTVSDVVDADVAVVGPTVSEADPAVADITVIINPDEETIESADAEDNKVALSESILRKRAKKLRESNEEKIEVEDKDEKEIAECDGKGNEEVIIKNKLSERKKSSMRRKLRESDEDKIEIKDNDIIDEDEEEKFEIEDKEKIEEKKALIKNRLYALVKRTSVEDGDPKFMTHTGDVISGTDDAADDSIKVFQSQKAADKYREDENIDDEFDSVEIYFED